MSDYGSLMKTMKMAAGAVVVLFRPSETHVSNLLHLKQLIKDVVAVDNSPVVDARLHQRIRAADIEILPNFNKGGVAGAYNRGIERLIEKICEVLFLFDQDSVVPDDYFTKMLNACVALGSPRFLMGPKIFDINVNRYLPAHVVHRFGVKPIPITDQNDGIVSCSSIITSGSVMSAETYRFLGTFREGYFIDHVDTEYSFRAMCEGVPVYINTSVVLKQELGKRTDHKFLFLKLIQWNTNPIRQYYSARNCIHISRGYGAKFPLLVLINIITLQQILSITLYENNKIKKALAIMVGILDGLRGRYGSFEGFHPRAFAFCTS
ncbi:MAG TPA: glycosyltransferase family 2 protein [Candidatus Acidoferrales bacterium]|nr:glycosyltransferase family 2 protein [Candidatus Acidoferrales bacterium]